MGRKYSSALMAGIIGHLMLGIRPGEAIYDGPSEKGEQFAKDIGMDTMTSAVDPNAPQPRPESRQVRRARQRAEAKKL